MSTTVNKKEFIAQLAQASRLLPKERCTVPSLSNFLLTLDRSNLTVTATNLEVAATLSIPSVTDKKDKSVTVLIPGKQLLAIVRTIGGNSIDLTTIKNDLVLTSGEVKFVIPGFDRTEYPEVLTIVARAGLTAKTVSHLTVDAEQFANALSLVIPAASTDQAHVFLTGVNIVVNETEQVVVATDGHRLVRTDIHLKEPRALTDIDIIVPAVYLKVITTAKLKGDLHITVLEASVLFECADQIYFSRLIDKKFPDYKKIIPKSAGANTFTVSRLHLLETIKRSQPFVDRNNGASFGIQPDHLHVSVANSSNGKFDEKVAIKNLTPSGGAASKRQLNVNFIADLLKSIPSEHDNITVDFGPLVDGRCDPVIFTVGSLPGFKCVVMPLRK